MIMRMKVRSVFHLNKDINVINKTISINSVSICRNNMATAMEYRNQDRTNKGIIVIIGFRFVRFSWFHRFALL